jgi:sugar/nucleoside kinase (ribokinase family)
VNSSSPSLILAGQLSRMTLILPNDQLYEDVPGGNVLYAAVGAAVWEPSPPPGLIARVGADFPAEWLAAIERHGFDRRGVRVLTEPADVRQFIAYTAGFARSTEEPVVHFARLEQPFPRELLGYQDRADLDSRTRLLPTSLRQGDLPPDYLEANAAHLCPLDYLTHTVLPAVLRQAEVRTVTLDPSPGYMNPTYWNDLPALVTGLTAFLPAEADLRRLFQGRTQDLWEMAEALAAYGCDFVVVRRVEGGYLLYDRGSGARWEAPPYPSRLVDPTGSSDAFGGGFLAGYRRSYDPLQALLHGAISASLVSEGVSPFYALDVLPGLPQARLLALQEATRQV